MEQNEKEKNSVTVNFSLNKTKALIAGAIILTFLAISSAYLLGAKSKDGQIKACHKVISAVDDALNDYDYSLSEARDNLEKCDPSYK